ARSATPRDETVLSSVLPHDRGYRRIDPSEIRALRGPRRTTMSTVRSTALWCAICLLSTGCEQWISAFTGQETGDEVAFGDGTARTYLEMDDHGNPVELGVAFGTRFDALPDGALEVRLDLPMDTPAVLPVDHAVLRWRPEGHEPELAYGL